MMDKCIDTSGVHSEIACQVGDESRHLAGMQ